MSESRTNSPRVNQAAPSSPNKFTVTRTTAVASKKRRLVADRKDLNMAQQRKTVKVDTSRSRHASLMSQYQQTLSSRHRHHQFLACILREVQHYQLQHHGVVIPSRAIEILAEHIAEEMSDVEVDNYATCLSFLAQYRVYSPAFLLKARKMVAAESAEISFSSSAGLSSSDETVTFY